MVEGGDGWEVVEGGYGGKVVEAYDIIQYKALKYSIIK